MSMVSALSYDRPLNVATPFASVTVKFVPWRLAVPISPRAAVTLCVLSLVITLPYLSSSLTTGWIVKTPPAVAVLDGCWLTNNSPDAGSTATAGLVPVTVWLAESVAVIVWLPCVFRITPLNSCEPASAAVNV